MTLPPIQLISAFAGGVRKIIIIFLFVCIRCFLQLFVSCVCYPLRAAVGCLISVTLKLPFTRHLPLDKPTRTVHDLSGSLLSRYLPLLYLSAPHVFFPPSPPPWSSSQLSFPSFLPPHNHLNTPVSHSRSPLTSRVKFILKSKAIHLMLFWTPIYLSDPPPFSPLTPPPSSPHTVCFQIQLRY